MYNLDWGKLIKRNTPFALRKPKVLAFLLTLISPVISLFGLFTDFRRTTDRDIQVTGQVRILRYWLNQFFDLGNNRIYLTDGDGNDILYIFLESENRPVYLPRFVSGSTVDFIVHVPHDLQPLDPFIIDFLERFKLASKRYKIDYFGASTEAEQNNTDDG